jgi:hypothetical protein
MAQNRHDLTENIHQLGHAAEERYVRLRSDDSRLLQTEPFIHQPLQARLIENVVGEFFVREHSQGGAFGAGDQFGGFFDGEVRVLADDRHHHADHYLQAADLLRLLQNFIAVRVFQGASFLIPRGTRYPASFHRLDELLARCVALIVLGRSGIMQYTSVTTLRPRFRVIRAF